MLALLLTYDLLLSKNGVAAPKQHALRLAIERHKARLSAELTKARIKAGQSSLAEWREILVHTEDIEVSNGVPAARFKHPRWIRINTLLTSFDAELSTTFSGFERGTLQDVLGAKAGHKVLAVDEHIPDLVAVPQSVAFAKSHSYQTGRIIFQDKASCIPAYLLDTGAEDGDVMDTCAAPGNKTTHLAALAHKSRRNANEKPTRAQVIFACERDGPRSITLDRMIQKAGANERVHCLAKQDFMRTDPDNPRFRNVSALLLDPSCSGSGIVGRDDQDEDTVSKLVLPRTPAELESAVDLSKSTGKKRKRGGSAKAPTNPIKMPQTPSKTTDGIEQSESIYKPLEERLEALSAFQLTLLKHAFAFPAACKIAYSTCSIHAEENEFVVLRALNSDIAKERGWRICKREEQIDGIRRWNVRGDEEAVRRFVANKKDEAGIRYSDDEIQEVAHACIRCEKGTEEGTMGFFAVKFVRDLDTNAIATHQVDGEAEESEEEWGGLSGDEYD